MSTESNDMKGNEEKTIAEFAEAIAAWDVVQEPLSKLYRDIVALFEIEIGKLQLEVEDMRARGVSTQLAAVNSKNAELQRYYKTAVDTDIAKLSNLYLLSEEALFGAVKNMVDSERKLVQRRKHLLAAMRRHGVFDTSVEAYKPMFAEPMEPHDDETEEDETARITANHKEVVLDVLRYFPRHSNSMSTIHQIPADERHNYEIEAYETEKRMKKAMRRNLAKTLGDDQKKDNPDNKGDGDQASEAGKKKELRPRTVSSLTDIRTISSRPDTPDGSAGASQHTPKPKTPACKSTAAEQSAGLPESSSKQDSKVITTSASVYDCSKYESKLDDTTESDTPKSCQSQITTNDSLDKILEFPEPEQENFKDVSAQTDDYAYPIETIAELKVLPDAGASTMPRPKRRYRKYLSIAYLRDRIRRKFSRN